MSSSLETKWTQLRGDGSSQPCSPDRLNEIKEEFRHLGRDAGDTANDRRELADAVRFARWPGQTPDGKKHGTKEKPAFPYEGASDKRERTADGITNEQVIVIMAALMRLNLSFSGAPGVRKEENDVLAQQLGALWEWVRKNQLGTEWFVEWTKFVQWRQGDSPAVGFMQILWHQERALKPETVTADVLMKRALELLVQQGGEVAPEDQLDLADLVVNEERGEELAALLQAIYPELGDKPAAKAARELRTLAETTFAYPYISENRLKLKARRLFHDLYVPENTPSSDFSRRARIIYVRDWVSAAELREREAKGEFKPGFLEEVLKHEGESGWEHWCRLSSDGEWSDTPQQRNWDKTRQRGLYELLTAIYKGSNAEGLPGTYMVTYHHAVDFAGTDLELIDYELGGGRYPFVASPREILSDLLWHSRGNSELSATEQNALKILHDMFTDNAALSTIPPLEVPAARPKVALIWRPMGQVRVNRPGEIRPMQTLPYPQAAGEMMNRVRDGLARYFGQISDSNPADLVRLYQQNLVDFMMLPVMEIVDMGLRLALQYLPQEQLEEIVGAGFDREAAATYRVTTSFEAGMLSLDYLKAVGELITNYGLKWDRNQTLPIDDMVKWFFGAISPAIAARIRPTETANRDEIEDEENNFTKIKSGIEPPMVEDGQNFALRRETLLGVGQKNPEAFQTLTPNSRLILEARLKHFDGMLEQEQNAIIGRTMAAPALGAGMATG